MKKMKEKKRPIQVCGAFFKYTCTHRADVKTEFGLCSLQLTADALLASTLTLKLLAAYGKRQAT